MKICLINCPIRTNAPPNNVPLGIYYLGAALKQHEIEVKYVDLNIYRPEVTRDVAFMNIPPDCDIYGISGLITTFKWQKDIAEYLGKNTKAKIISGGGLASNIGGELLEWIPFLDEVFTGEGENTLLAWLGIDTVYDKIDEIPEPDWDSVEGLETYIANPIWGGEAKNSSYTPFRMSRSLNMISSRGCPFSCKFCSKLACGGNNYRPRSAESVADEFNGLVLGHSLDFIGFVDDNLTASLSRLDSLRKHILFAKWGCHSRFDAFRSESDVKVIRDMGCVYAGFGGESANPYILKAMDKRNDPEHMKQVIEWCRRNGIHPNVTWMIGWPGETREQMRETAQFILQFAPENKNIFVATSYPGTELWEMTKGKILSVFPSVRDYVEQLGDATLPVMNYSALSDDEFIDITTMIKNGRLDLI